MKNSMKTLILFSLISGAGLAACSKGSVVKFGENALSGTSGTGTTSGGATTSTTKNSDGTSFRLMDRTQMATFLFEITKPDGVVDGIMADGIAGYKNNYYAKFAALAAYSSNSFGRPCIQNEMTSVASEKLDVFCSDTIASDTVIPDNTTGRESSRVSVCETVATFGTVLTNNSKSISMKAALNFKARVAKASSAQLSALTFASANSSYTVSDAQKAYLQAAYQVFYPGQTASDDLINTFVKVIQSSNTALADSGWTNLFLTLCYSPEWQTI